MGRLPERRVFSIRCTASDAFDHIADRLGSPPSWHQPQLRFLKRIRKQRSGGIVHAFGSASFLLGADGVEIDEPRLEQGLGDGFQRGVGFAQEGDAVVYRTQNLGNLALNI
ncbi:hypothetical protein PTBPS01_19665 [Burkholderia pseudomallei]|nr:hypothetical protein PTBPS01_19665 [Burkholderia pseudomallei]